MGRRHIVQTFREGQEKGGNERPERKTEHLQRCHVIEGMVQLLTNGLVLQLLSIQFIWRSEVDRKYRCQGKKPKAGRE